MFANGLQYSAVFTRRDYEVSFNFILSKYNVYCNRFKLTSFKMIVAQVYA